MSNIKSIQKEMKKFNEMMEPARKHIKEIQEHTLSQLQPTLQKIKEITKDINPNYIPTLPLRAQEHYLEFSQNLGPISKCGNTIIIIVSNED